MLMLNIFDDAGTIMLGWLRIAMMSIIANVYNLIATFYNIFMYIVKVNILSGDNESLVSDIYNRIQVILAVVMVFYVTLEFVKYIVNPDTFSDKEKGGGGLLKRILIVIVLMAFTPQIFGIAYDFQGRIISSEVIPKVLIKNYNPTDFDDNAGGAFSSNLLAMFYKPYVTTEGNIPSGKCGDNRSAQQVVNDNLRILETKGKMVNATYCIAEAGGDVIADGEKHVNPYLIEMGIGGLLPLVIGCFMIWVLVNYCAEAGRVIIQFVFLQIIAPIPILSYVAPGKDGMFNKWVKQCTTTYLDLFIRLFIMYLILMLSQILIKVDINTLFGTFDFPKGSWMPLWIKLFLFIGLCLFAMKAPKMVKELLPGGSNAASGDFGIGGKASKERFKPLAKPLGAGLGVARGVGRMTAGAWRQHQRNKANEQTLGKKFKRNIYDRDAKEGERWFGRARENIAARKAIKEQKKATKAAGKSVESAKRELSGVKNSKIGKASANAIESTKRLRDTVSKIKGLETERTELLNGREVSQLSAWERGQLNKLDQNLSNARTEYDANLKAAQTANKISRDLKQPARQDYANALQELKDAQQSGDVDRINKAQKKLQQAEKGIQNGEKLSAFFQARDEYEQLKKDGAPTDVLEAAKQKMVGSLETVGNVAKISMEENAQSNLDARKAKFEDEKQTLSNMEQQYTDKIIKENHDEWRAPVSVGSVVSGVAGIVHETVKGLKTKEITDVLKDHVKAQEQIVQRLDQQQANYDAGGPVGLGATVQRTVEQVSKHMGFGTTYERIQSEIKPIENQIKQEKAASTVVESISTSLSDTKKSVEGARGKHKLQNSVSALNGKIVDGGIIEIKSGETADSALSRYAGIVEQTKKDRDVSNERRAKAEMALNENKERIEGNISRIQTKLIATTDDKEREKLNTELSTEENSLKILEDELMNAEKAADENTKKYDLAERLYGNVQKEITDLTMEQAIQATARGISLDDVGIKEEAVGNDALQLITNLTKAKSDPKIVEKLRKELTKYLFDEFMKPNYSDAKIADMKKIDDAIKRIVADIKATTSSREEKIRQAQLRAEQAKLVSDGGSSGSGKK